MARRFLLPVLLVVAVAAGCGGGGGGSAKLAASDVAVVGSQHITKSAFDQLMNQAKVNLKAQGQTFPKAGTAAYSNIKSQAVTLLVAEAEKEAEATKLGIKVSPKEVTTRLDQVKKQQFKGSEKAYLAEVKKWS